MAHKALGDPSTHIIKWWCNYCNKSGTTIPDVENIKTAELCAVDAHDAKSPTCEGLLINLQLVKTRKDENDGV